ncbi:MAG TPA: CPBP family intramembrane glutamic endopeptidase [Mycobacterium sp.]|jgi:hypothetical protein
MDDKRFRSFQAIVLATALVSWSFLPSRNPLVQATLAGSLAANTKAPLGFRPPALWAGLRLGAAAASTVAVGVAASTALPRVRTAMAERSLPSSPAAWLAYRIPVGTVFSEETAYRGALATVGAAAFGTRWGRLLQAAAFGLSHIADARAAGESVVGTVAATGVAGWVFGRLAERSGSIVAPMLTHLAINEAGAVAALLLARAD